MVMTDLKLLHHELIKRVFHYLFTHSIANKEKTITQLFISLGLSDYEIPEIFQKEFPYLIKGENDPNLEVLKSWLALPEERFANESLFEDSKEAACMFFLKAIEQPSIFDYFMSLLSGDSVDKMSPLGSAIFSNLLSCEYETKINPTNVFDTQQINSMLDTTLKLLFRNMETGAGGCKEAIRTIYYLENPLAKPWLEKYHNNVDAMEKIAGSKKGSFSALYERVNEAIESALEYTRDREHYAYLEFKDDASHKFWEISFDTNSYTVNYGKVGTGGRKNVRDFESIEDAHQAGQKLIAQKLKKGYQKVEKPYAQSC